MDHQSPRGMWLRHKPPFLHGAIWEAGCPLGAWASGLGTVLRLWSLEGAGEHIESTQYQCPRVGFVDTSVPELLQDPCCGP